MTVLQYHPLFIPFLGGVELNILEFCRRSRYSHVVFTDRLPGTPHREIIDNIEIVRVGPSRVRQSEQPYPDDLILDLVREIRKMIEIRSMTADVFHLRASHFSPRMFEMMDSLLGRTLFKRFSAATRGLRIPSVTTFHSVPSHGLPPWRKEASRITKRARSSWEALERWVCETTAHVICVDWYMVRALEEIGFRGRCDVIYSGIDTERFRPLPDSRLPSGIPSSLAESIEDLGEYVLYVGRLDRQKGIDLLPSLARRLPDELRLVVAGKGRLAERDSDLVCLGPIGQDALPYLYNHALAVVNPVAWHGVGRTTMEAMACGKPVIVFDPKANRKPLRYGVDSLCAASADEFGELVTELNENRGYCREIGEKALETSKQFSVDALVPKVDEIYARIAS
ncbi:MAG: glycosyltransferase family 4 protein [Thermoplasmata archaeon]